MITLYVLVALICVSTIGQQGMAGPAGQELRSTDRPIYGASSVNLNDSLYIYGGFYSQPPWNMEALFHLPNTVDPSELEQISTDPYASPTLLYGQTIVDDGVMYAFGGHHPTPETLEQSVEERLRYYRFNFANRTWTPLQQATTQPLERYWHSAVVYDHHVFLFGGMNVSGPLADAFWKYDIANNLWTALPNLPLPPRCGHTASMLSTGEMVIIGGYDCIGNYTTNPTMAKTMVDMHYALIYNTVNDVWRSQAIGGKNIPSQRTYHTAVTTKDDRIVICGGQNGAPQPFQTYAAADDNKADLIAVLDTTLWEWIIPPTSPYQPFPRSFAIAGLVNETRMVFGFGINYHTIYDGLYVFDIPSGAWILPPNMKLSSHDQITGNQDVVFISGMAILGTALGTACVIGLWLAITRCNLQCRQIVRRMTSDVWNPRPGEPLWAETSRLLFRLAFMSAFVTIIIVLILQVRNSAIIDQKYYAQNLAMTVDVPDIRFCFDGWDTGDTEASVSNSGAPYLQCSTDFGNTCTDYVIDITKDVQKGLSYYGTKLTCYLFRAPTHFRLGRPDGRRARNGSYLKFYYYGARIPMNQSRLHTVFYNKYHDPNLPVYGIEDPYQLGFSWYGQEENADFQSSEQENLQITNAFDLNPNVVSSASYELIVREKIRSTAWNFVGIATQRDRVFDLSCQTASETLTSFYETDPQPLGSLHVFPIKYQTTVLQEQKAFTLVNAMGIMGGISGLLLGLQACLFGYRPRSPWGILHRWSIGQMKLSLLRGLRSHFPSDTPVPIVHPIHRRFTTSSRLSESLKIASETLPGSFEDTFDYHATLEKIKEEAEEARQAQAQAQAEDDQDESETDEERMTRLEARLHILETLFQAYYIDDEVFRSLDHALRLESRSCRRLPRTWNHP